MSPCMLYFIKAWLIGIAVAAPVGPIGMLCIKKSIKFGVRGALSVGLGASVADVVYGLIAAAGLTAISGFLTQYTPFIKIGGGLFLIFLGIKEMTQHGPLVLHEETDTKTYLKIILQTFALTLTNPMTILSFVGIFATLGSKAMTMSQALIMVAGIFGGTMTWWLILGTLVASARHYVSSDFLHKAALCSASILIAFGAWACTSGILSVMK